VIDSASVLRRSSSNRSFTRGVTARWMRTLSLASFMCDQEKAARSESGHQSRRIPRCIEHTREHDRCERRVRAVHSIGQMRDFARRSADLHLDDPVRPFAMVPRGGNRHTIRFAFVHGASSRKGGPTPGRTRPSVQGSSCPWVLVPSLVLPERPLVQGSQLELCLLRLGIGCETTPRRALEDARWLAIAE